MSTLSDILAAVDKGLAVVKMVAETPGINVLPYASTVSNAITAIQAAEAAGKNLAPYVDALNNTFQGDVPTPDALAALDATIINLDAQVDAPLPPKEANEPE